ncbi:MAG: GerMN domain-containing protein [Brevinema sp.]
MTVIRNCLNRMSSFTNQHKKNIRLVIIGSIIVLSLSITKYIFSTKNVYYLNKDSHRLIHNRIVSKALGSESSIQAFLRHYLSGSSDYKAKIPFTHETRLLTVSHDRQEKVLILNWNSYFYKVLEQDTAEQEITLLLFSLKKNFSIETVLFLVEGSPLIWNWKNHDLGNGISINEVFLEKNKKNPKKLNFSIGRFRQNISEKLIFT